MAYAKVVSPQIATKMAPKGHKTVRSPGLNWHFWAETNVLNSQRIVFYTDYLAREEI